MPRRLLFLLIFIAGVSIAGGVYKWVDEHGHTVFSEKPPSGKTAQQVKLPPQPPKAVLEQAHQEEHSREELEIIEPVYLPPAYPGDNQGSETNRRKYVTEMIKGAKTGKAGAQFILGVMYEKGIGFTKDEAKAARWYRKVSAQENARSQSGAQSMLGLMYADGRGVKKDSAEAMRWFSKVMKKRYFELFSESDPLIKYTPPGLDKTKVMNSTRKNAESGIARYQTELGDMYAKGFGVNKDEAEAVKWYRKAAEQGFVGAYGMLGLMYAEGRGIGKDPVEAMKWYIKDAQENAAGTETMIRMGYEYGPF